MSWWVQRFIFALWKNSRNWLHKNVHTLNTTVYLRNGYDGKFNVMWFSIINGAVLSELLSVEYKLQRKMAAYGKHAVNASLLLPLL
jgi:hypothetical protein